MNELKKAASHPDVPRPSNDELIKLAIALCNAIERCGASPELTEAVCRASDLLTYLVKPDQRVLMLVEMLESSKDALRLIYKEPENAGWIANDELKKLSAS